VKIHRIDAQKDYDEQGRRAFGDNPIYLAIGPDAAFLVFGADGVETIKKALAATPQAAEPLQLDVSLGRLAPAIAINRKDTKGEVVKAAQDAFGQDRDADRVRLVVEGGKTLRLRFSMKTPVLKFISELDKAEQAEK
jgi:phosphomannomutase